MTCTIIAFSWCNCNSFIQNQSNSWYMYMRNWLCVFFFSTFILFIFGACNLWIYKVHQRQSERTMNISSFYCMRMPVYHCMFRSLGAWLSTPGIPSSQSNDLNKKNTKSNEKKWWNPMKNVCEEKKGRHHRFVIEFNCDIHYVLTLTITITDQHITARHRKNAHHYAYKISTISRVCRQKITHGKSFIWILNWDNK